MKMSAKFLKIIGNILILLVILVAAPISLPRFFGVQGYNVISGSMEPTISVGSIVYVKAQNFNELSEGDIIAFESGASVVTHRIISIDESQMLITTKGDANENEDFTPVAYTNVLGKVIGHIPFIGMIAAWLSEASGKIVAVILLICGVILSNIGDKKAEKSEGDKQRGQRINPKAILVLGLVIIFGALGGYLYIFMGYQKTDNLYAALDEAYVKTATESSEEVPWDKMMDVDFDSLLQINPDVIGWIYVEGTDISYPIMYSGDDEAYLRTSIDGKHATAGSIFLEGYNLPDFSDSHNIIYGHNMRNLSMFGTLKFYKSDVEYYDNHRYFQIITPEEKMRFEIFSYFDTEAASWVYAVPYSDSKEFGEYIAKLLQNSYINMETESISVSSSDKIVTLSTCSTTGMRFTLHGVLQETVSTK